MALDRSPELFLFSYNKSYRYQLETGHAPIDSRDGDLFIIMFWPQGYNLNQFKKDH